MSRVEPQNTRYENTSSGGKVANGWSDISVDSGLEEANRRINYVRDPVNAARGAKFNDEDFLKLVRTAGDYGQVTAQEWDQIKDFMIANHRQFSPEAMKMFETLDIAVQDIGASGAANFDPINGVVIGGDALNTVMGTLGQIAAETPNRDTGGWRGGVPSGAGTGGGGGGWGAGGGGWHSVRDAVADAVVHAAASWPFGDHG